MTLAPASIGRCLEVLGSLVRAQMDLNAEFEGSVKTFFQGGRPGAAGDPRETLLAGRRHLEWFLLEHHSPAVRGSVAEKLAPAFRETAARSMADEDGGEAEEQELVTALDALLRSHTGVFEVESTDAEETVWARDLGGFGTYALSTVGLEGRLRHGDLLVGRLYPAGDGGNVASPTIAIVRSDEIREALTRDLGRAREETSVNVLRVGQRELEAMFFGEAEASTPDVIEEQGGASAEAAQDPRGEAMAVLFEVGIPEALIHEALEAFAASPRDPARLVHGVSDPMEVILEKLAFDTEVDLEAARGALIRAWDLASGDRSAAARSSARPAAATPSTAPASPEEDDERTKAIDEFSLGRAQGQDAGVLLQKLEEDLGIAGNDPAEEDADSPAPDFPGVVGAMIEEMKWELTATREGFDVALLDPLSHLATFARPIGVFEELKGRDLFQFSSFWLQEANALSSDEEAGRLVRALREFCEWALDAHEVDLGSEFLDALDGLESSLPRMRHANGALEGSGQRDQAFSDESGSDRGQGYELIHLDEEQPGSFETSGDRVRACSGDETFTVILPAPLRPLLAAGDFLRLSISLEGHAEVFCCYPPEARSLMGG